MATRDFDFQPQTIRHLQTESRVDKSVRNTRNCSPNRPHNSNDSQSSLTKCYIYHGYGQLDVSVDLKSGHRSIVQQRSKARRKLQLVALCLRSFHPCDTCLHLRAQLEARLFLYGTRIRCGRGGLSYSESSAPLGVVETVG